MLDGMDFRVFSSDVLFAVVHHHELDFGFVRLVQARLVENVQSKHFGLPVWSGHFQKSVNLTDCRNVVWNEGFQFSIKVTQDGSVSELA